MTAHRQNPFAPDYAVPPGATLEETMHFLGMTQRELADRTGLTVQTLNRIFKGEQPITYETANKLELVTGTPAAFWNNLEAQYRGQFAKIEEAKQFESQVTWLKIIPVSELVARKAIPPCDTKVVYLREILRFYGVSTVEAWHSVWDDHAIAARRAACFASNPGPTSAWLRLGQLASRTVECAPYDKKRFQENLGAIRGLTTAPAETFVPEMRRLCAESGVALALIPEMKKAPWSGAADWLNASKAMIILNLRGKAEDKFWFTFFHEASHILHDSKKATHIDDGKTYADDPAERRADEFAAETLIPRRCDPAIKKARSAVDIRALAQQIGVSPGIVVGRFQHLTKKWTHFHALKLRFDWKSDDE